MHFKKLALIITVLALALVGVSAVSAQDGGPGRGGRGGPDGRPGNRPALAAEHILMDAVSEATGLTQQEIVAAVREGATLSEVIEANGGDVDAVVASAVTAATERINEAVDAGTITRENADTMIENLETVITNVLNREFQGRPGGHGGFGDGRAIGLAVINQVAEATGLTRAEIIEQAQAGATLADILTSNGVDVDSFVDGLIAQVAERLAPAVESGRISQEDLDARLVTMRENLIERLNQPLEIPDRPNRPGAQGDV